MATAVIAVRSPETCDCCGVQAYWRFDSGTTASSLCLCTHHCHEHAQALRAAGFTPKVLVVRRDSKVGSPA